MDCLTISTWNYSCIYCSFRIGIALLAQLKAFAADTYTNLSPSIIDSKSHGTYGSGYRPTQGNRTLTRLNRINYQELKAGA